MSKQNKVKKDKKDKLSVWTSLRYNLYMLGKIAKYTPQYIVFMFIVGIMGGISNSLFSIITFNLFNLLDEPDVSFGKAAGMLIAIIAIQILINLFYSWYYEYYQTVTDKKLQHKMHEELFLHALKMDLACFDDPKFYNDYVWAMDESKNRAVKVLDSTHQLITALLSVGTLFTLSLSINIWVALIILVTSVARVLLFMYSDKLWFKQDEEIKEYARKNDYINRVFHLSDYAKELRMGVVGRILRRMHKESFAKETAVRVKYGKKIFVRNSILNEVLYAICTGLPIIIMLFGLFSGNIAIGGFAAMVSLTNNFMWTLYDLLEKFKGIPENARYIGKYMKFIETEPTIISGALPAASMESIELRNVSFAYASADKTAADEESKYSLQNVDLTIHKGEKIAIVGYNGAGKTTLTKLLMRLYDPTDGEILYNGVNLKEYDIPSYRERIGTVFQDFKIFAATIGENVMGGEVTDDMRVVAEDALANATFDDKLAALEKGLDTPLTKEFYDEGVNLSGGEAQKVAIARIFARPFEMIIMDEPSSALDPSAEYELNHTILDYAKDKTVIFISHRLSTTRMADRILMFAGGRLIEQGSHDELMAKGGKYAEMFELQAEKYRN